MRLKATALFTAAALFCAGHAAAQNSDVLKDAIQKAVNSNPDVTARFNAYRASADAIDVARGGYYPRVDLNASVGRDRDRIDSRAPVEQTLNRNGVALSVTQLLWDGLATQNEVGRLGHERLARYFDVVEATEQTSLEVARAYYDVLRYRRLVQLAEDNYVQHRGAFNQISSRFRAGVGRGVDLEQAGARQALAESNLTTELSNLHDVSARYQRIVGEAPPRNMPLPVAFSNVPANATEASNEAVRRSAAISASIETLRSAQSAASSRNGAYSPRLEARARSGGGKNFDGVRDQTRDTSAEIVLNWNLFNGGADRARIRQATHLLNQAADVRDKTCRDTRQTVAIAYNDTRKLTEQLTLLDRNTLAIEKARDAYRQQFDIGQRSLLDLLNSENELYTARRSYANAEYDLAIAYVRTQAAIGQFAGQLGLTRDETAPEPPSDADHWNAGSDAPGRCAAVPIEMAFVDTTALNARAAALNPSNPTSAAAPANVPAGTASQPVRPAAVAPAVRPVAPLATEQATAALSVRRLNDWAAAWESKQPDAYLGFYAPDFTPARGSADAWRAERRRAVSKPGAINVKLDGVQTRVIDANTVETRFKQSYRSANFSDTTDKVLTWRQTNGQWFIVKESGR